MAAVLFAFAPYLGLILLGAALRGAVSETVWAGLDRLNYLLLMPVLIFTAIAGRALALEETLEIAPAVALVMLAGLCLGLLARRASQTSFLDFAGLWQISWRFNTALALVAAQSFSDAHGALMAIVVGVGVPLSNLMAILALSRGQAVSLRALMVKIAGNPFLIASVGGLAVSVSGAAPPTLLAAMLDSLAAAAIPMALLSIGATLSLAVLAARSAVFSLICALKLLALPALTFAAATALGLTGVQVATLTLFAAMPPATSSHVLADAFGSDRKAVATLIAQSTAFAMATVPLWMLALTL